MAAKRGEKELEKTMKLKAWQIGMIGSAVLLVSEIIYLANAPQENQTAVTTASEQITDGQWFDEFYRTENIHYWTQNGQWMAKARNQSGQMEILGFSNKNSEDMKAKAHHVIDLLNP